MRRRPLHRFTALAPLPRAVALFAVGLALNPGAAPAQPGTPPPGNLPADFQDVLVVGGLHYPSSIAFLPDGRLLVAELFRAKVRLVVNGALAAVDPVVTVDSVRSFGYAESGLLGIAPDPGWPARPYIYVQHTASTTPWSIRISRFTAGGDLAFTSDGSLTIDRATRYDILTGLPDQYQFHNGGTVCFGPDGMLYSGLGDDLSSCLAQDVTKLQGKILRLDVSGLPEGPGGPPDLSLITPPDNPFVANPDPNARLVWAYGLRNPYSFHFDPGTGVMYIADVGAGVYEEVDRADRGGLNFGWPYFEGPQPRAECGGAPPGFVSEAPIYAYDRTEFLYGAAVISGGLYRRVPGAPHAFPPGYDGSYFLSDEGEGFLRRLVGGGGSWSLAPPVAGQPNASDWGTNFDGVVDYETAPDGALWYSVYADNLDPQWSSIRRIVYTGPLAVEGAAPEGLALAPPRPSPSSGPVGFEFSLPSPARVDLAVYDLSGRRVCALIRAATSSAGLQRSSWSGDQEGGGPAPSGVYFARLVVDGRGIERPFVILR